MRAASSACSSSLTSSTRLPVVPVERRELLLLVRDARRQRKQVPVDVGVALLRAEAEHVQALGLDSAADGERDPAQHSLELEVLVLREFAHDVDAMVLQRDAARDELAEEARPFACAALVGGRVERHERRLPSST